MYVNVAVLKETQPHERRVALTPSVAPKLIKLGARLHMQTGAADSIGLGEAAFPDVAFIPDRSELVANTDVALVHRRQRHGQSAPPSDKSSPIFGMPIMNVDKAQARLCRQTRRGQRLCRHRQCAVLSDNCNMVYGDAEAVLARMIEAVRGLGASRSLIASPILKPFNPNKELAMAKKMQAAVVELSASRW